jgi:AmiR/NasT family two-component response regulator
MRKSVRALIVEDEPLVGEMIQRTLEDIGCTVAGKAVDGLQAIEMAQTLRPDVILMDLEMPNIDGIEATRCIYKRCPTPVVILTAYEDQELVERASAAGAGAYLIKPPDAREMERAITIAMARFDDMMELRRLNAALERFTHTVSHDLKSPLIIITGFLDLLEQDIAAGDRERIKVNMAYISDAAQDMQQLLDELLELSRNGYLGKSSEAAPLGKLACEASSIVDRRVEQGLRKEKVHA